MEKIKVLIAEDHPIYRDGLRTILLEEEQIEIIGEASAGEEVITLVDQLLPDLILMDIRMEGMNGIEATRNICSKYPSIKVLMLTMFEDDGSVFSAMRAGAKGYLLKGAKQKEIIRAIHSVYEGEAIFSPSIASRMMSYFDKLHKQPTADVFPELTTREREILHLLAQGLTIAAISTKESIATKTTRNHISNILNKLQVTDKAEAIILAKEAGLGNQD